MPFCRCFVIHSRHPILDVEHNQEQLHASVSVQTTPVQWCGHIDSTGTQRICAGARGSQAPLEMRNRSGPAEREKLKTQVVRRAWVSGYACMLVTCRCLSMLKPCPGDSNRSILAKQTIVPLPAGDTVSPWQILSQEDQWALSW